MATLPPIRLFLSGLWFSALLVLFRKNEQWLVRLFKGLFLKFGQNSLLVYVIHGFILFPSFKFLPGGTNFLVNTVIDAVVVSLIYMVVIWHKKSIEILMRWLLQTLVFLGVFKLDLLGEAERD
jgi:fucose 4-O-acetylase-like acetyltransferase